MQASIVLDQPGNVSFTNLDQISGKVVVRCGRSTDVESITVKLEGESRTRLLSPTGPNGEKAKPQLEYHKILYRVQVVFPSAELTSKSAYTLPAGTREYPFSFKIPFNNSCSDEKGQMPTVSVSGSGFEVAKPATQHVRRTLPPTLSGFPGEAEVRYYIKATIKRHAFWKENPRAYAPFNFLPIQPPRPLVSGNEVYARQRHAFNQFQADNAKTKVKSMFSRSKEPITPGASSEAPSISVDARLPEPAILTCNEDIPLRILIKKLNESEGMVYLQSLQISLIGSTKIRAHNVHRTETNSWVLMSKSNMGLLVGAASDRSGTENVIPDNLWRGQSLPNTVAPSFETCNISRVYQLDVRIGLSYAGGGPGSAKPQTIILPLRLDVEVYSGIAPPRELLEAMAEARANVHRTPTTKVSDAVKDKLQTEGRKDSTYSVPPTPIDGPEDPHAHLPAQQGTMQSEQPYTDAPPSYEDAIASNLPPVNASRPDYALPPADEDDGLRGDEKRRLLGRRDS